MDQEKFKEIKDIIAPPAIEINPNNIKLGNSFLRTIFVLSYPRFLGSDWFIPIINLPRLVDISIFVHPVDTSIALRNLRKKAARIEAQISDYEEKGVVRDPILETAFHDIETLRDALQQAREKLFNVGIYLTFYGKTSEELDALEKEIGLILESKLVYTKAATFQQLEGFSSMIPLGNDVLEINNPLNSGPISSFFPFVSTDLTSDKGILYGINKHNNTLIIFDRFSLENANMVIFAKSGGGKSYFAKMEILRALMTGTDVLVIDPENEYENLAEAVGGTHVKIALTSEDSINPFDLPSIPPDEDAAEVLKSHIVNLSSLIKIMVGKVTADEESILDKAITETYASREIIAGKNFAGKIPPLLEDLESVMKNMSGGKELASKLYRFTKGSFAGFVNKATNININNRLVVFSIRDLEEELRPIAMHIVLSFIWNLIRGEFKKRLVFIDEAWVMMKHDESASFLFGLVKRARKYFLGITTITQDVEDFINSSYGRPIVSNSSMQLLLKQSTSSADVLSKVFGLSSTEKNFLVETEVGSGLFFAGLRHVAMQVIASFFENQIITTNPEELIKNKS
ncbi:MAG: conjugal transfer protein TraC [Candidatus Liptonbacteria bacterium RIFOXYC1_FULL_36_8]|uniref:Conjugal transfer protein TraC n=1 Tax=Candidatus Liptonbacteria bacterium RIFOXYC1_FULL_36_8 TaxID=1798655 RepID=A0A1G2CR87_9BACT|nr:MAG: conjugal transfer protein TraC [Candidatus Liptonbacteria bacterium RIFOXYC1_FULL_36_8]